MANNGYNPLLSLMLYPKVCVNLLGLLPTSENPPRQGVAGRIFARNGIIAEPLAFIIQNLVIHIISLPLEKLTSDD